MVSGRRSVHPKGADVARGNANRSATVGRGRERTKPPATAAAEPLLEPPGVRSRVPGIARDAEEPVLGERGVAELRRVRLADRDRAGPAETGHLRRVGGRDVIAKRHRAASSGDPPGPPGLSRRTARRRAARPPHRSPGAVRAHGPLARASSARSATNALSVGFRRVTRSSVASTRAGGELAVAYRGRQGVRWRRRRGRACGTLCSTAALPVQVAPTGLDRALTCRN